MYSPPAFAVNETAELHQMIRDCRSANLVTATVEGLMATFLPMFLDPSESDLGVLYGHFARANGHWKMPPMGDALAIFQGPEAYITPSWYASKQEHGKVVPTWNYTAVQVHGPMEIFDDADRLLSVVERLTRQHESGQVHPWSVSDAPAEYVEAQLRGIVGVRLTIRKLEGKRKMSQNRSEADRLGVRRGLLDSIYEADRPVAGIIPV